MIWSLQTGFIDAIGAAGNRAVQVMTAPGALHLRESPVWFAV